MVVRWKPKKSDIEKTVIASDEHYKRLASVATETILNKEKDVIIAFPYFIKFSEGFPKGIIVKRTETMNVYRIKAKKLLNWLYDRKHVEYNFTMLIKAAWGMERKFKTFDRKFENIPSSEDENMV